MRRISDIFAFVLIFGFGLAHIWIIRVTYCLHRSVTEVDLCPLAEVFYSDFAPAAWAGVLLCLVSTLLLVKKRWSVLPPLLATGFFTYFYTLGHEVGYYWLFPREFGAPLPGFLVALSLTAFVAILASLWYRIYGDNEKPLVVVLLIIASILALIAGIYGSMFSLYGLYVMEVPGPCNNSVPADCLGQANYEMLKAVLLVCSVGLLLYPLLILAVTLIRRPAVSKIVYALLWLLPMLAALAFGWHGMKNTWIFQWLAVMLTPPLLLFNRKALTYIKVLKQPTSIVNGEETETR